MNFTLNFIFLREDKIHLMKALLINPHKLIPVSVSITQQAAAPLGLAYIASVIESKGFEVSVFDCIAEAPDRYTSFDGSKDISVWGITFSEMFERLEPSYDLIGLSAMFTNNWLINRELIDQLKKRYPKAMIIAGGEHVSAIPEYCLKDSQGLDLVVVGEGEETMGELAEAILHHESFHNINGIVYKSPAEPGRIMVNPPRKRIRDLDGIKWPAWHLFPLQKYFEHSIACGVNYGNSLPIFSTRGCPYECTFCSSPGMWGMRYTQRNINQVVAEIKYLNTTYNVTNIDFYDLTAIINRQWILDFCAKIKEEGLKITWQIPAGTRSEAIDFKVASALKEAGCKNITYAPESGSEEMLKQIKKKVVISRMLKSIDQSYKAGLDVKLNILIGYPDEKAMDILKTIGFLIKASYYGATDASPSMFSPYPGSELFKELQRNKELELSDKYFRAIVFSQSLHKAINYNRNNTKTTMLFLLFFNYFVFYLSNYFFRPVRAFRFFRNIQTGNYQTRGEFMLGEILKRRKMAGAV